LRGDNVHRIWENTQRVQEVWGEERSFWGGSDEKAEAWGTFTFPLLVLFCPNPPTSSVRLTQPPEPFAYSPGSGGRNQGTTGYHGEKGGGQGCVDEGCEDISPGHKVPAKRSLQTGAFRARGGRGYALGAWFLGRTAPGCILCLQAQRGHVRTKRAGALASGTGVYIIRAWTVRRTGRTGRARTQGNIFAGVACASNGLGLFFLVQFLAKCPGCAHLRHCWARILLGNSSLKALNLGPFVVASNSMGSP